MEINVERGSILTGFGGPQRYVSQRVAQSCRIKFTNQSRNDRIICYIYPGGAITETAQYAAHQFLQIDLLLPVQLDGAAILHQDVEIAGRAIQSTDELYYGFSLVISLFALFHSLAEECGIKFETIKLVFDIVDNLQRGTPQILKRCTVLIFGY